MPMNPLEELYCRCTVRIVVDDRLSGTGAFVAPGLVLTCAHVVATARKEGRDVGLYWRRTEYLAKIDQYRAGDGPERYPDLALLRVPVPEHPHVILDPDIKFGDLLFACGFPDKFPNGESVTLCYEGATQGPDVLLKLKHGKIRPSLSGAALLNTRTGLVCGVVNTSCDRDSGLGLRAIPAELILTEFGMIEHEQRARNQFRQDWSAAFNAARGAELQPVGLDHHSDYPIMSDSKIFDCLLSHNRLDKPAVRTLAKTLSDRGISVWLDEERLRPGVPWQRLLEAGIRASKSVAVLVGASGIGPWEEVEMRAVLSLAVKEERPVIPVLLPDAPAKPVLPMFLEDRTWVDMRAVASPSNLSALDTLIWGITGNHPGRTDPNPSPGVVGRDQPERNGRNDDRRPPVVRRPANPFRADSHALIGRDRELIQIFDELRPGNHCSLVGPPSSGKSLLLTMLISRVPQELDFSEEQVARIYCHKIKDLNDFKRDLSKKLIGRASRDLDDCIEAKHLQILALDDFGSTCKLKQGATLRQYIRGLSEEHKFRLLMVSNSRLDELFKDDKENIGTNSPLAGLVPYPLVLGPLSIEHCRQLVETRLAGTGIPFREFERLCDTPQQPRDLLNRCAEHYKRNFECAKAS